MNSLRSVQRALEYEIERQTAALDAGETVVQETRHFDESTGTTSTMRTKEEAEDYRYFPEPDLVPLRPPREWIEELATSQPELPAERRSRLVDDLGVPADKVALLQSDDEDTLSAALAAGADAVAAVNWITAELRAAGRVPGDRLAELLSLIADASVSTTGARTALKHMVDTGSTAREAVDATGVAQVSDQSELEAVIDRVLAAHPDEAARLRNGEKQLFGWFMGEIRNQLPGFNPTVAADLLRSRA